MSSLPLHVRTFGFLSSGEPVEAWTLTGAGGLSLQVLTYGGIVRQLRAPDRRGRSADVVLGFDTLEPYLARHPYFGAITGRVAGRIAGGRLPLDGRVFRLAQNDGPNHLHGGFAGLDRRLWRAASVARADGAPSVRFAYLSPDGEEGYPGEVNLSVTYTVTADNAFAIETEAVSDRPTPVSLTHHSYFNLEGEGSDSVAGHEIQILSEAIVPTDASMALSGQAVAVAGQACDFNRPRRLGDVLPRLFRSHGDLYLLGRTALGVTPVPVARVFAPESGRVLTVSTTETCFQLYTGVSLDGTLTGKAGRAYGPHAGLCLECEGYPDAMLRPGFGDILVRPGQPQRRITRYEFSVADAFPPLEP